MIKKVIISLLLIGLIAGGGFYFYTFYYKNAKDNAKLENEINNSSAQKLLKKQKDKKGKKVENKDISDAYGKWKVNTENSLIKFNVGNGKSSTPGKIKVKKGGFYFSAENNVLDVILDVSSISTYNGERDEHIMEEDFFHVEKYPEISFKSNSFIKQDNGYLSQGTMTMKGASKTIDINLQYVGKDKNEKGEDFIGLIGNFKFNRLDFNMESNNLVPDSVYVKISIEANPL